MRAINKDLAIKEKLNARGVAVTLDQARTLRRAEHVLHRWAEMECGLSDSRKSWCITRDESTGVPYTETSWHCGGKNTLRRIADRESGALKRVAKVCADVGAHFYHQGDCRGVMLYVALEPLTDANYSNACAVAS
jgi:hypothetical protein